MWEGGGLNAFILGQNLDFVVVKAQACLACIEDPTLCNASSQINNLIKLIPYDVTKKMTHDSQVIKAKANTYELNDIWTTN